MATEDAAWLAHAIELAVANVEHGGGPFGAVVVRHESPTSSASPTASVSSSSA